MSVPNVTGSWQTRCGYGTVLQSGWSPDGAGRVFRKFYTHCPPEVALYEYGCARWLHEHDIPSPRPIRLLEDSEGRKGIESEWLDLHLVRDAEAARAAQDVLALVRLLHRCPIWPQGRSWQVLVETEYLPELVRAADWYRSRLGESSLDGIEQAIAVFKDLRPDGFIHGDFSPNNVGYQGRALHCLDFRHGSEGPRDWDIGYFLCHFAPGEAIAREILAKTTAGVAALATVASAIRLGRRLRRGDDPVPGLHRLLDWISWQRRLDDQAVELPAATVEFAVEFMRRGLLDDAQRMLAPIARFAPPQGRAAHGAEVQAKLSSHAMATHMRSMAQSLDDIVEPEDWEVFNEVSTQEMAQWLLEQAALVPLKRYAKAAARKTAPTPAAKRTHDPKKPHVSLAKLLADKAP